MKLHADAFHKEQQQQQQSSIVSSPVLHSIDPINDFHCLNIITPQFVIPKLQNKPQDPIVQALENVRVKPNAAINSLEVQGVFSEEDHHVSLIKRKKEKEERGDVWTLPEVVAPSTNRIQTWDDFQDSSHSKSRPSPFLSEQPNHIFDAVRYHVNFKLEDPMVQLQYVLPEELWASLQLNLLGNSSSLFIWDSEAERLMPKGTFSGAELQVTLEGIGHGSVASTLQVFLNIGTHIRRIDSFIHHLLQNRTSSTVHAFLYSLNSVTTYIESILSRRPQFSMKQLVGMSAWYRIYDQILTAVASLCQCIGEPPFTGPPTVPHKLLDHIFKELEKLIFVKAPREVIATLAYILTTTSNDYFRQLSSSIGLLDTSESSPMKALTVIKGLLHLDSDNPSTNVVIRGMDHFDDNNIQLPTFLPKPLVVALPAARKSLSILKSAGLPCWASLDIPLTWVWTAEELGKRWLHSQKDQQELLQHDLAPRPNGSTPNVSENGSDPNDPLSQFAIFDLEPGSHLASNDPKSDTTSNFVSFLTSFPDDLPIITPTLLHVAEVVLRPLSIRTMVLSNISLRLILDSLHLGIHLRILRSNFFLTSSSFKRRLVNALLHDESLEPVSSSSNTISGVAIGLARGLSSDKTWPPKGSDLSFSLRNVIVNSLEEDFDTNDEALRGVIMNAEQNLGFGLRDLPLEHGEARWLNPISIEALDFLYLDYKTIPPLDVIVTPQIITKYQRMFTFLLRLTRAEIVMRISYRNIHSSADPLLPYASKSRSTAHNLFFQLQTFLNSLSGYTYDSVIGGTFDKYLTQMEHIRGELRKGHDDTNLHGMNIFVLAESHSRLLDKILRCCLLKGSHHRHAGNVLRGLLDLILRFGSLFSNLRQGILKDFEAEERLLRLDEEFKNGMLNLVIAIRRLQEAQDNPKYYHDTLFLPDDDTLSLGMSNGRDKVYLEELLTRLDPSYWWRRQVGKTLESTR